MQKVQGESASSENVMMESKWNKYSQIRVCRLLELEFNEKKAWTDNMRMNSQILVA